VRAAHGRYAEALLNQCGRGRSALWANIMAAVRRMLNAMLRFSALQLELLNARPAAGGSRAVGGGGSSAGGSVASGSVAGGNVAGGSVAGGSVAGSVAGGPGAAAGRRPAPGAPTRAHLAEAAHTFRRLRRFLLAVLTRGHASAADPELRAFVLRINFNGHYAQLEELGGDNL
jgi:hypothetical protein